MPAIRVKANARLSTESEKTNRRRTDVHPTDTHSFILFLTTPNPYQRQTSLYLRSIAPLGDRTCIAALDWSPSSSSKGDMHCGPGFVPVFLKERQSLQPQTGLGTWSGPSSNIRPRESGISHAQALPAELNRFALNRIGLPTASAHRETAGVAIPVRSFRFSAGETAGVAMPVRFSFCFFFFRSFRFWGLPPRLTTGLSSKAWNASVLHPAGGRSLPWRPISGCAESTRDIPREAG
jgi:hypothetical protein